MATYSPKLAAELVSRCFHARTIAHILHLRTNSFAVHKALEFFYDEIVDLVDEFAEVVQANGLLIDYPEELEGADKPLELLLGLRKWIAEHRASISDESHVQNIIDGIVALVDRTIYRVRFLK